MARRLSIAALLLLAGIVAALPTLRWLLWRWESNSVLRGRLVAERSGCFNCHLASSRDGIPNPGSRWGSVPRFSAGNAMMYAESEAELEEFIRFGAPRAWLNDEKARERLDGQHLRMPAYEGRLTEAEIADLVAYVAAVELAPTLTEEEAEGRALARRHGCLDCHGVAGSGGLPNPGSLGGFIPGFSGRNFEDLVEDEAEFRQWVLEGTSSRLANNPLIAFFWKRQAISMPAYREELTVQEVDRIWQWVARDGQH